MDSTLILENAALIRPQHRQATSHDILIRDGLIESVGEPGSFPIDAESVDCSNFYILPGLVNAHTHSHNTLFKGFGDGWNLELLLTHGPALNSRRTPEDHYWAAVLNGLEMLQSGVTEAYDLVIHSPVPTVESIEAVVQAYRDLGMRAIVAPAFADRPLHEIIPGLIDSLPDELRSEVESTLPAPGAQILANVRDALRSINISDRVRLAIAPTIPAQCTDELLLGSKQLADEFDVGLHTHLAESHTQAVEGLRRYGKSLTAHLNDLDLLSDLSFVAAHGVWLNDEDLRLLSATGATVAHNPASNLRLASGIAPIRKYLESGVEVALGSDGSASSDNQSIFEAMRLATHLSRLWSTDPRDWLSASDALDMAICGGARACGHTRPAAPEIAEGMPADLVMIRRDSLHMTPATNLPSQIVACETDSGVDSVMVAGEFVLRHGKSPRMSIEEASVHCQKAADRLLLSNRAEFEFARQLSPYMVQACGALAGHEPRLERGLVASQ